MLGKSLVIVTGVGYGVIKAMDALASDVLASEEKVASDPSRSHPESAEPHARPTAPDPTMQRLDGLEQRLIRMERSIQALTLPKPEPTPPEHLITRAELDRAMQRLSDDINTDVDRRFEVQNRSVQSLRSMIARTDELLEQVIENIESTQLSA